MAPVCRAHLRIRWGQRGLSTFDRCLFEGNEGSDTLHADYFQNQAKSDISKAELDLQFAQEDVPQYVEGEYPKQEKELKSVEDKKGKKENAPAKKKAKAK